MRCKSIVLLLICFLFVSLTSCLAAEKKDEWKSPDFKFSALKTILVNTGIDPKAKLDEFDIRKLDAFYSNNFFQTEKRGDKYKFQFITINQLKDRISKATGKDMQQLETEDPVQYKSEIDRFTPIIADAIFNIKITSFGYDERFVAESFSTYTEQVETEIDTDIQDSKGQWIHGKKKITRPVERTVRTPAHYDTYANVGMDYILVDSKTNKTIWMLRDVREARGKAPIDMTERIINRAADCLLKI